MTYDSFILVAANIKCTHVKRQSHTYEQDTNEKRIFCDRYVRMQHVRVITTVCDATRENHACGQRTDSATYLVLCIVMVGRYILLHILLYIYIRTVIFVIFMVVVGSCILLRILLHFTTYLSICLFVYRHDQKIHFLYIY